MTEPFHQLLGEFRARNVRYVLIGVGGANYWALSGGSIFHTRDRDLFLPLDPENLVRAWEACEACGLDLTSSKEPLDRPRDLWLAGRVVGLRALTCATDGKDLLVDLTFVMAGYEFEEVWNARREFLSEGVPVGVAPLAWIVRSKATVGRQKDHLFLATLHEALRQYFGIGMPPPPRHPRPGASDPSEEQSSS